MVESITIGENCHISRYGHILSCGGNIIIGNNSTVNPFAMVYGQGGLKKSEMVFALQLNQQYFLLIIFF